MARAACSRGALDERGATQDQNGKRRQREEEEKQCIGGMRRPWLSMAMLPAWAPVGRRVQQVLERVVSDEWLEVVEKL
eukprot:6252968-Amphidinium_carterae.1